MKKRCLLIVASLLFSWAGFAQLSADLLAKGMDITWDETEVVQNGDGTWTATYSVDYSGAGWSFDMEEDDVRSEGYVGVELEFLFETSSVGAQIMVQYGDEWIDCGTPVLVQTAGIGKATVMFDEYCLSQYPVACIIIQNGWGGGPGEGPGEGDKITITKAELLKYIKVWDVPKTVTAKNGFENFELEYPAAGAPQSPVVATAYNYAWGWPSGGAPEPTVTIATDPIGGTNKCLKVVQTDWSLINFFMVDFNHEDMNLGKTFGEVKEIKFKIYYESGDNAYEGQLLIALISATQSLASDASSFGSGEKGKYNAPLCYWSYDRPIDRGIGSWEEYTFETKWFTDDEMNDAIGDGLVPQMSTVNPWSKFQFGIGIANAGDYGESIVGTYYIDDIEFVFDNVSVKSVAASSAKVFSIPGGLVIDGVESAVIYGIDGSVIATATGTVALPKGVYIVKAGSEVVKAIVK